MGSVQEQLHDTLGKSVPVQIGSPSHTRVGVDINAQTDAIVNAPVITGNNITGPVTINCFSPAGNELEKYSGTTEKDNMLQRFLKTHKMNMKEKAEFIFDVKRENETHLKDVYTEVFITEGDIKGVNEEHEILNIDEALKTQKSEVRPIPCNDIFSLLRQNRKTVLTKGIAGIGKTVTVHKFILDWAEEKANHDVDCMFLLPFREINLIKDKKISLHEFLSKFYPELKELEKNVYKDYKLAFIFDGLDESRLPLNFEGEMLSTVEEKSTVDELFINLVKGNLLPSALIWVTSRPAAANQIPPEYVGLFTEVQGFTDEQKEEYFRKRIKDETQASRIITHIKRFRSLYIMCYIPVFCWITATVLQENISEDIPTTLTEMYIHFLLIQINMKNRKYDEKIERNYEKLLDSNKAMVLKLAKLAYEQLKKQNTLFYEEEVKKYGICVSDDSTGMLMEIFKKEAGLHEMNVFCFVHLSVQEFLAALHVFFCYMSKNMKVLQYFLKDPLWVFIKRIFNKIHLHKLLKKAVDKAMGSQKGHLDLFLRFLLGISLESSQKLLKGLFTQIEDSTESIKKTTEHIKQLQNKDIPAEASVNLFYCLLELKDKSLYKKIQIYLNSDVRSVRELSPSVCSVLTYVLLMSEEVLDEFNMKMFKTSPAGYMRLIPAMRSCRTAILSGCNLTDQSCETLASALQSSNSPLRDLDLSNNDLQDSGVKLISDALKSPNCQLEILRLSGCMVTEEGCCYLASALRSNPSHLRELDLSYNHPGDSGVKLLFDRLNDPKCRLEKLNVDHGGEFRITTGLHKWVCDLTLDPNTAHPRLSLSDENRRVTHVSEQQPYPDHPERFDVWFQVLCRESLSGRCYWEAEWSGERADLSVAYKAISRKGGSDDCQFGFSEKSWSLRCLYNSFTVCHKNMEIHLPEPSPPSHRVGVYLDCSAGTLSFYSVSDTHTLSHLHTFRSTFTEPLYAGIKVYADCSVTLCHT